MKSVQAGAATKVLERSFPASPDAVESFIADMRAHLKACGLEAVCFDLELMAREALGNAVRHGSRGDSAQCVSARLAVQPDRVELCVADSGAGFDWRNAPNCLPNPSCETGRGLCILKHYADTVEFNDSGNTVCISKLLPFEEGQMSTREGTLEKLTLATNVSANNVQALRELFKQHLQDGVRSLELDFRQVESIDSVGIGLLVATHNSLAKAGGSLALVNVSQDIHQLFTLMRLDKHFSVSQANAANAADAEG